MKASKIVAAPATLNPDDIESAAIDAHARLVMLGSLLAHFDPENIDDTRHDVNFADLGNAICDEAEALNAAFYDLWNIARPYSRAREAANG